MTANVLARTARAGARARPRLGRTGYLIGAVAPIDDEPETPKERSADLEGIADLERGDALTTEQLRRELGL